MSRPVWLTTTSGPLLAASAVVLVTTAAVGVNTFNLLGSSSGGTGTTAAKPQQTPSPTPCNNGNGNGIGNCPAGSVNKTFAITGSVQQLVPGAQRSLSLSLTNNASQAIKVKTLSVQAADVKDNVGVVVCAASNLLLGSSSTAGSGSMSPSSLQVPGNGTVTGVNFPVRLAASAGNGCKGVTWQLTYSGTADQA